MSSKTRSRAARIIAAGVMLASWAASAGTAGADPDPGTPAGPSPANAPEPGTGPKTTIDKDGTYAVGTDIAPGIYSSAGPVGEGTCYWKRTGNPDGNLIDNALTKKPQVVKIEPTDKAFKTTGCQPWQNTPDATPPPELSGPAAGSQLQGSLGDLGRRLPNGMHIPNS